MPGLGAVLIVLLPELGKMSRKQIAVLRLEGMTFPICGKAPSRAPASLTLTLRLK